ncbi:MAG: protoheme IX farnesyltransferase [Oceanicaulis sp.]
MTDRTVLSDKPDTPPNADPLQDDKLRDAQGRVIETVKLTPEEEAARKRRNLAIAFGLVAFTALIFVVTVVRMSSNYNAGG